MNDRIVLSIAVPIPEVEDRDLIGIAPLHLVDAAVGGKASLEMRDQLDLVALRFGWLPQNRQGRRTALHSHPREKVRSAQSTLMPSV